MGFELRDLLFNQRRNNFNPRQRQRHNRRVDLIFDLERDVRFNSGLVHAVLVAPLQDLILREVRIRSERSGGRCKRAGAVARSAVGFVSAVASPVGGDYDIDVGAFGGLYEKAFDEPEDGHIIRRSSER